MGVNLKAPPAPFRQVDSDEVFTGESSMDADLFPNEGSEEFFMESESAVERSFTDEAFSAQQFPDGSARY